MIGVSSSGVSLVDSARDEPADPDAEGRKPPETVVGRGCEFEGVLTFRGEAWIEGKFRGQVSARGTLGLSEDARVDACVDVDELIVEGEFEGEARARLRIELRSTARVKGSLEAPRVRLDEGCVLHGRCRTAPAGPAPNRAGSP